MKNLILVPFVLITIAVGLHLGLAKDKSPSQTSTLATKKPLLIRGSIPYWDQQKAAKSFAENISKLDQIALFWYYINAQGKVTRYKYAQEDVSILTLAHRHNIKVFFTLTNLGEQAGETWDSKRVERVIKNQASITKHIKDVLNIFTRLPFDGMTIDYESVAPNQRQNFSSFIKQLAASLHDRDKLLAVALHPINDSNSEKRYYFQNFTALAKAADYLPVMAYGEHENDSGPGPIAPSPWIKKIIAYLKTKNMNLQKVFLGIPLYGYDWTEGSNKPAGDLTYQAAERLLTTFDPKLERNKPDKSPHFSYSFQGQNHQVWFEDSTSVEQKMELARQAGLGGISFWRLGEEDPRIWTQINQFK